MVSSNGTQNGIVWALMNDLYLSNGSSVLYAFNATNVAQELYDSNQNSSRDNPGTAIKFTIPVVTNGKVYVGRWWPGRRLWPFECRAAGAGAGDFAGGRHLRRRRSK